jgi:hypothetical protein
MTTSFTTRVELHQANEDDYRLLNNKLKKAAFIAAKGNGNTGNLTFRKKGNVEIKVVIDAVINAAAATGKKFSFTVMKDKYIDNRSEAAKRLQLQ